MTNMPEPVAESLPHPAGHLPLQPIRFLHRGKIQQIQQTDACAPTRTVLQYLREDMHCKGSKEACAEGDCGACTVVVGELHDGAVRLQAINACIQFVPSLDGKALYTVEDLQQPDGSLHPVQQALVDCHASQCGFCTPGFVMSLWALYEQGAANQVADGWAPPHTTLVDRAALLQALSGNLCRCTGYKPIIDAGLRMHGYPVVAHPAKPLAAQLQALQRTSGWAIMQDGAHCFVPHSRQELGQLRRAHPDAILLAGGTDIGLWQTKQLRHLPQLIYLGQMQGEMRAIRYLSQPAPRLATNQSASTHAVTTHATNAQSATASSATGGNPVQTIHPGFSPADAHFASGQAPNWLEIGALVSLNDAYGEICRHYPHQLHEFWQRFASHPIRNIGTLGGNLANGSPIGDSMPWLITLGAQVVLHSLDSERVLPLEAFYLAYQKKDLRADEWLASVRLPLPASADFIRFRTYKLSKRFDQDISAVCAAFVVALDGESIVQARVAYGGMAATPKRAPACEAALLGQRWDEATLDAARAALAQDFQPLSDMRASSAFRLEGARQLLTRFWLETRPDNPLPATAVNVFAHGEAGA